MVNTLDIESGASGVAALSICESLLLALGDLKIMKEDEIMGVITDAADAHRAAGAGTSKDAAVHLAVVAILDRIVANGNSVRRP